MKRRQLLKRAALASAAGLVSVGVHGWAWRSPAKAVGQNDPRLIVIFLRGGADGLNIVVPYQDERYYALRPGIAVARPGEDGGALDLTGQFGLHPALDMLMPSWQAGELAFVHATGAADASRSHFRAQDYVESGTGSAPQGNADGWLNRLMATLPERGPTQAVNIGTRLPLIFTGAESVANLAIGRAGSNPLPIDRPQINTAFDQLYANHDRLAGIYQEGRAARDVLLTELEQENEAASRGAPTPDRFEMSARYLARLMSGDAATQIAFMEVGDWDTHINEPGRLNRNLGLLGTGLAALKDALGAVYDNTTIAVISEFGRTASENGNRGTDHGTGNALWLMGGRIRGGEVYGDWPGLAESALFQNRDLAITTDYRDVLMSLLSGQFSLENSALSQIFPGHQQQVRLDLV